MKVGFITMEKVANRPVDTVGSSRIRARWVAKYWDEAEEYMLGRKYDVLIFQKAWWESMIREFEGIKIFDICDPDWFEGKRSYFGLMSECDAVTTSTPALANYIGKLITHIPVICIPDRLDLEEHQEFKKVHSPVLKEVAWFGYSHNFYYLERTFDKLIEKGLSLKVIADKGVDLSEKYKQALKIKQVTYDYRNVHREIIGADAVLMPEASGDLRASFKSNNKTLTAWALGMPVIQEPGDMDRLGGQAVREKEGQGNRAKAVKDWDVKLSVKDYKKLIKEIQNAREKK
jgi:hypothetical protein